MSGPASPERPGAEDPSMEDILASIRRILSEDEAAAAGAATEAAPRAPAGPAAPDVLALDESMLVHPPAPSPSPPPSLSPPPAAPAPQEPRMASPDSAPSPSAPPLPAPSLPAPHGLVAPEAAAAAASSMDSLVRTLTGGRPQPLLVTRAGTTLEDIVRDELRPVLKAWLDEHLPALVERLVRAEIERVVGRATDL